MTDETPDWGKDIPRLGEEPNPGLSKPSKLSPADKARKERAAKLWDTYRLEVGPPGLEGRRPFRVVRKSDGYATSRGNIDRAGKWYYARSGGGPQHAHLVQELQRQDEEARKKAEAEAAKKAAKSK